MQTGEILLPITKPETEWVRGRALQKMSPTRVHAILQTAVMIGLRDWAGERGDVLTGWRFRIAVPGEPRDRSFPTSRSSGTIVCAVCRTRTSRYLRSPPT